MPIRTSCVHITSVPMEIINAGVDLELLMKTLYSAPVGVLQSRINGLVIYVDIRSAEFNIKKLHVFRCS